MHVIKWVTKTGNRDGKNLRHLKSQKINMFQSFLYFFAFNLVFRCPTRCQLKTTCLLLMKQKLYTLDAFFIEKLKLSENDPPTFNTFYMSYYATGVSISSTTSPHPLLVWFHQYKLAFNIIIIIFDSQSVVTGVADCRFGVTHITCHAINRR